MSTESSLYKAMVIGVSAGGLEALTELLPLFPADFPIPIIIVQHRRPEVDNFLARYLDDRCPLHVVEAEEKEPVRPGVIYLAPPGYHVLIEDDETFALSIDEQVNYARPSVDVLFESASDVYGPGLIGVVLTGANKDGALGSKKIKENGGDVLVMDPESAYSRVMPDGAIDACEVDFVGSLKDIAAFAIDIVMG
ncbi:MAG: chemotaxis protein CheB [bacterium]|nr:chemotaxis protein CheB [bacterium]